ncbi:MAG: PilZ domain-containing protein [Candidatus Scalindua sp.]|nr:PilZ domain-containing protein [Candidatus Scalindua sp.]
MNEHPNDREYVRVVKPYIVKFRVKDDKTLNTTLEEWVMVTTNNFSAKGIFFFSDRNLEVGTILELIIDFSHFHPSNPSIVCVGKIIRISLKRHVDMTTTGFAIEFTEIHEQTKKMLCKIVDGIVTRNSRLAARSLPKYLNQT